MKTFRSKLLASFIVCMCAPAVLGFVVYLDLEERRALESGLSEVETALAHFRTATQEVHEFWTIAERDVGFYETGTSPQLDRFYIRIEAIRGQLTKVSTGTRVDVASQVDGVIQSLDTYEAQVDNLSNLLMSRGFLDYGKVGEMRETIHALESRVTEPDLLVQLLTLRRNEKDYIIRNQEKYVAQLESGAQDFQGALAASSLTNDEKNELIDLVITYAGQFKALVEADAEIGMRGGSGAYQLLMAAEGNLTEQLNVLRASYTTSMLATSEAMTDRLFISIALVVIVAIVMGYLLSNSMTRPLKKLSRRIESYVASDFAEVMPVERISQSDDEVGQIARNFSVLQDTMQKTLDRLQKQKHALVEQRHRLSSAQRMAKMGYWRWDETTKEVEASEEVTGVVGVVQMHAEDPATFFGSMVAEEDRARFEANVAQCLDNFESVEGEFRLATSVDREVWIRQHVSPEMGDGGSLSIIATVQDITEQRRAEQQIRHLAYFDNLTGLATRGYMNEKLQDMINSARRRDEGFALFFIDLDKFKEVNDSLGHDAGDALLVEVAARLKETARDSDFVARLGGDEFCMLFENVSAEVDIAAIATRCLGNIVQPLMFQNREIVPAASIGIARFPEDGTDAASLMKAGDNAMYAAKKAGFACFEFHNHQMSEAAAKSLRLGQEIRAAVREKQFVLFYQPQISVQTGAVHAWEALIRWEHPEKGILPPGAFIEEVERLSLINELGDWVIDQACAQIQQWEREGLSNMRVSVNIAPKHLTDPTLFTTVKDAIRNYSIDPEQLEIEVTETGIQSAPEARDMLNELKTLGVTIAIDDFGTGYSSLGSLKHLPVDCLKVDRAFVKDVATNPEDIILLRTIMSLAQNFDFQIIAEGVEDLDQIHILRELECDLLQGYYFSKPIPAEEVPPLAVRNFSEEIAPLPGARKLSA